MRRYPVWDILYQDSYDSVVEALKAVRALDPDALSFGAEQLHPPELMRDLDRGVDRVEQAIRNGEKILIYGDYDVDGVASTTLLLDFLKKVDAPTDFVLPDRRLDGYGIKPAGVRRALERGAELIITVDNGISAHEAIDLAGTAGVDVVVVDHHQQHGELPAAHSVINPNRRDCSYPFKGLAGVGVTFKFVQALSDRFIESGERRRYLNSLLDLVALGTVADVVPVLEENRVFIQRGLEIMRKSSRPGLRQLREVAGLADKPLNTTAIGFYLGPRINVAGRLTSANLAMNLLNAHDEGRAAGFAEELNELNGRRQKLQREAIKEAESLIDPETLESDRLLVLLGETWHLGILGLLAGNLAGKYHRPAVVCTGSREDGTYTGSARSIPGYDISAGISACSEHLIAHGGHAGAAGLSMQAESFEAFRIALLDHAEEHISSADLQPRLTVDMVLRPTDVAFKTLVQLQELEPFGRGNEIPVFATEHAEIVSAARIGRGGVHCKMALKTGDGVCQAVWWDHGGVVEEAAPGQTVSIAFALEEDYFAGRETVQMVVKDMFTEN